MKNMKFAPPFQETERARRRSGTRRRPDKSLREGNIEAAIWEEPEPRIVFVRYYRTPSGWMRSSYFRKQDLDDLARLCRRVRSLYGI